MSGQTRLVSLIESLVNLALGMAVGLCTQLVMFPIFDIQVTMSTNIYLLCWFTGMSFIRTYLTRRWFNARLHQTLLNITKGKDEDDT